MSKNRGLVSLVAVLAATLAVLFSSCSNTLDEYLVEDSVSIQNSVSLSDGLFINEALERPCDLAADVSTDNVIVLSWRSVTVSADSWNIYLDGEKVDETSTLKQVLIDAYSGDHVVSVCTIKDGSRSLPEELTVNVKGVSAPATL